MRWHPQMSLFKQRQRCVLPLGRVKHNHIVGFCFLTWFPLLFGPVRCVTASYFIFNICKKKKIKLIIKTTVLFLWIRSTGRRCRSPFRKIFFTGLFFIQMAWHFHHFVVFLWGFLKKFYAGFFGGKFSSRPVKCAVSNAINSFIFQSNLMRF